MNQQDQDLQKSCEEVRHQLGDVEMEIDIPWTAQQKLITLR